MRSRRCKDYKNHFAHLLIDGFYHCRSLDALFPSKRNDPHDVLALQAWQEFCVQSYIFLLTSVVTNRTKDSDYYIFPIILARKMTNIDRKVMFDLFFQRMIGKNSTTDKPCGAMPWLFECALHSIQAWCYAERSRTCRNEKGKSVYICFFTRIGSTGRTVLWSGMVGNGPGMVINILFKNYSWKIPVYYWAFLTISSSACGHNTPSCERYRFR